MTRKQAVLFAIAVPGCLNLQAHQTAKASHSFERKYSAAAYVSFLGIPIFSRDAVGYGFAGSDEGADLAKREMSFTFLSATDPVRAHGLNRFGLIQEQVRQSPSQPIEIRYWAFMTASGEDSLKDAKNALEKAEASTPLPLIAAQGTLSAGNLRYEVTHIRLARSSLSFSNAAAVAQKMRTEVFTGSQSRQLQAHTLTNLDAGTFLWSVWRAIVNGAAIQSFSYGQKDYQLMSERKADKAAGEELARDGLVSSAGDVQMMNCSILERGQRVSAFRVWFDPSAANWLPLRFEFKPKSYLRLVYKAQTEKLAAATVFREETLGDARKR